MTDITPEMIEAAKSAYWSEVHHGGGYSDKCYAAAIQAALCLLDKPEAVEATSPQSNVVGDPVVPITTGMPEVRVSLIARAVRQSLRNYGHKVAESTLPECIAGDVERTLAAHEKTWAPARPPRDFGINGGDLSESRDNIGSAYTRSTPSPQTRDAAADTDAAQSTPEAIVRSAASAVIDELAERFAEKPGTADDYADYMRRIPEAIISALKGDRGRASIGEAA
ncbi:hypothetical protein U8C35_07575 [Sinorhizobium medicae]|uniref:hypothetical protein n=1 Tax=Sinorhizobium medicae TaxID=110321 RepID=UPI002AF6B6FC|nr:hypothetical protein [Sinorhizobium medicae]WQO60270.1 hypothetical protein U8C35_07575 [Sinorhizobium medicae]